MTSCWQKASDVCNFCRDAEKHLGILFAFGATSNFDIV
jgi:hypothetical protein